MARRNSNEQEQRVIYPVGHPIPCPACAALQRSVGLVFQQDGVQVEINNVNPVLLAADLKTAIRWREEDR